MMAGLNKVMLIGNLGADPELRFTANGAAVANFRIACSRSYTDRDGQRQEVTEWVTIVAWQRLAELCGQYLSKGRPVFVEGRLQTRQWQDREGNNRYTTEVVANDVQFLGGRGGGGEDFGGGGGGNWEEPPGDMGGGPDAGDLPFE
ncbi:MAG: single-stranded DNA-binding protein [Chloroflexi bacterium]|nr:single-stranded DNA-binding protein [Chloroflexota bacterium]MYF22223.1 single-stranded DNA-binding protein [Chloroflexota bacterium]